MGQICILTLYESKKGKKTFSFQTIWNISRVLNVSLDKLTEIDIDEFTTLS